MISEIAGYFWTPISVVRNSCCMVVWIGNRSLTLISALKFTDRLLTFKIRIGIKLANVTNPRAISTPSLYST